MHRINYVLLAKEAEEVYMILIKIKIPNFLLFSLKKKK